MNYTKIQCRTVQTTDAEELIHRIGGYQAGNLVDFKNFYNLMHRTIVIGIAVRYRRYNKIKNLVNQSLATRHRKLSSRVRFQRALKLSRITFLTKLIQLQTGKSAKKGISGNKVYCEIEVRYKNRLLSISRWRNSRRRLLKSDLETATERVEGLERLIRMFEIRISYELTALVINVKQAHDVELGKCRIKAAENSIYKVFVY